MLPAISVTDRKSDQKSNHEFDQKYLIRKDPNEHMKLSSVILVGLIGFALLNTGLLGANYLAPTAAAKIGSSAAVTFEVTGPSGSGESYGPEVMGISVGATAGALQVLDEHSLTLTPASWLLVGGFVVWRGRVRANWMAMGFDSDVFELFVTTKGAGTRVNILNALSAPKDRLQLARELGLSWRSVDRHVAILNDHGLLHVQAAYGRVKLYSVSIAGKDLLNLVRGLECHPQLSTRAPV